MPYAVIFTEASEREFATMDRAQQLLFAKHLKKLETLPPRKFLKGGERYAVEQAGQGRIVCRADTDRVLVIHVFPTHKEYEAWYRQRQM